jgi:hypothetical protein
MTAYETAFRKFRVAFFIQAIAEHECDAALAAEAIGIHRNTMSRILNEAGYPLSRIRRIVRQRIAAGESKPVQSESMPTPVDERRIA